MTKQPPSVAPSDDIEEAPAAPEGELARARRLAQRILTLREEISRRENELSLLESSVLPKLMDTAGLSDFTMSDGSKVALKPTVKASIPDEFAAEAFNWLDAHGHGDLIKHHVTAAFGRSEAQRAAHLVEIISTQFPSATLKDKESVHAGTLTAFVKEQLKQGTDLPLDYLGVMKFNSVNITSPKIRKNDDDL